MTEVQKMLRDERIAIMIFDGGCTEDEAQEFCDNHPEWYGIRCKNQKQLNLLQV